MSKGTAPGSSASTSTVSVNTVSPNTGRSTIGLWHRMLVDRIAESRWLRGRSGKDASWFHYEHHARAGNAATERHARARARAERLAAHHGAPRLLRGWQAAIGQLMERQDK
jgi:hypothetical protein